MRLSSTAILDKHVPFLNILYVKIFANPFDVDSLIRLYSRESLLKVLSVGFELILCNSVINSWELIFWINWCCLLALSDKEFFGQFILDVDIRFMVNGVQHDKKISKDKFFIFFIEIAGII